MNDLDVKNIRLKLNISQTELADMLGIHMRTIQNWESGGKIPKSKYAILRTIQSGADMHKSTTLQDSGQSPVSEEMIRAQIENKLLRETIAELKAELRKEMELNMKLNSALNNK